MHFGSNPGWCAHFVMDTGRREGFAIANNSMRGNPLNLAVHYLWLSTVLGEGGGSDPQPAPGDYGPVAMAAQVIAALLVAGVIIAVARLTIEMRTGRRQRALPGATRRLLPMLLWGVLTLTWGYWFYTPWPLPLPTTFPDLWRLSQMDYVMGALLAWCVYSLAALLLPRREAQSSFTPVSQPTHGELA
jgi:hypothetical protein